ncbi:MULTISPECIES: YciI family protein [Paenibacillus]|uniref:YciI family protein n=1 Tax=Paenibacillus TaxID=44249 RepID=UPI0009D7758B|nr:YciI family protein [Paenibacillus odorifer]
MSEVNQADICYVILLSPTNQDRRDMEIIRGHVKHLQELDRKGQLVLCGPFSDCPGGMVIVRANSREEAVLLAEKDPYVLSGIRSYEVRTWSLSHEGNRHLGIVPLHE